MQKINQTLLEARKSYRFLYDYQKRILDLISFIGGKYGLKYKGGYSKFSNSSPRDGKGNLGNWAWDWLNLYFYEFNFEPKKVNDNTIYFAVFILNDTGFFEAHYENEADKLNTNTFKSVEESESKLIFVVGKNMWKGWGLSWDEPEFISKEYGNRKEGDNGLMFFKHYSLENFENEEKAISCIKDFENNCLKNDIELIVKNKPF